MPLSDIDLSETLDLLAGGLALLAYPAQIPCAKAVYFFEYLRKTPYLQTAPDDRTVLSVCLFS